MKREAHLLLNKSTDSLLLSVEHFNRPWDRGRTEAVLILLDRSFELLLKSAIVHLGGRIREAHAEQTIGFGQCVRKCVSDSTVQCLTEEQALTIQLINSLRDAAQHYIVDVSEQQLYTFVQSGVTLYGQILEKVFHQKLSEYLPQRVMPVSANPPQDLDVMMDIEFQHIQQLLRPGTRRRFEATAKLRSMAIVEASLNGKQTQPAEPQLQNLANRVAKGEDWRTLFPGIHRLQIADDNEGLRVTLRIAKQDGQPVVLVQEGTPGATVVAIKRVDELGYYSLGLTDLSSKLQVSSPRLLEVIRHLKMQENPDFFKEIKIKKSVFKRYSAKALSHLTKALPTLDINAIWAAKSAKP